MNASNALMSICNAQNNSFVGWRGFTGKLCEGKDNNRIWQGYTMSIHGICHKYTTMDLQCKDSDESAIMRQNLHVHITTRAGNIISSLKMHFYSAWISDRYMQGIYQAYTYHISSAAIVRAFLVSQERLDASDLDLLRILSVLDTESPPTLGWGLPKFHSQSLTSYTWLPLRDAGPWPSAHPNSKACFCRPAYLYGIVDVVLPARWQGNSGTRPRRSSKLPT